MSYRVCAKCDYVIDNRIHQEYNCPECNSDEMLCPVDDDRDWQCLFYQQKGQYYLELASNAKSSDERLRLMAESSKWTRKMMDRLLEIDSD